MSEKVFPHFIRLLCGKSVNVAAHLDNVHINAEVTLKVLGSFWNVVDKILVIVLVTAAVFAVCPLLHLFHFDGFAVNIKRSRYNNISINRHTVFFSSYNRLRCQIVVTIKQEPHISIRNSAFSNSVTTDDSGQIVETDLFVAICHEICHFDI